MSKTFISLLFISLLGTSAHAQNIVDFRLNAPVAKASGNLYRAIKIMDLRNDTTSMGFVKTGFFDRRGSVIPKTPLTTQLSQYFYKLADTTGKTRGMLLLLRRDKFEVMTIGTRDYGAFSFRANLFEAKDGQYRQIASIDTISTVSSAMTVTTALLDTGKKFLEKFISDNVSTVPNGAIYSYNDILHLDSMEKRAIKLYNTPTYADGLYLTYKSFMNQMPDKQITVEPSDVNYGVVNAVDANGNTQRVKPRKVYALVYHGQPYISSRGNYYPLKKDSGDFYFTGAVRVSSGVGNMVLVSSFGMLGALIGSGGSEATFYVKLDHVDGGFIQIKRIEDAPPVPSSTGE
ncbi:hypothetical protein [Mucilaginibacter sp. L196]|uniref:hypothetical protein n=1 Tax=Mucilaginibacter sp. L196 TaxID=1641870 RepID=UPI00131CCC67|nr:hypothetical protein [Mucilaginibacter sp. L196]